MLSSPLGDILVGVPYWDIGDFGQHNYVVLVRDAAIPLTQATHVSSRQDSTGNIAKLRWNDFGLNGNSVE